MAREIHIPYGVVGSVDVYLRFRNASGQYRRGDTGAYETFDAGNIALYGADTGSGTPYHVASEDGSTGDYFADLPDSTARGWSAYLQAGAAPSADGGVDVEIAADVLKPDVNVTHVDGTDQTPGDIVAILTAIKGAGWTDETLVTLQAAVDAIDPLDATETQDAAAAAIADSDLSADLTQARKLLEAQRVIDQTTEPWQLVLKDRDTGAELLRFDLADENGDPIDSIETFVAEQTTPA